jgi:hypothetical protein
LCDVDPPEQVFSYSKNLEVQFTPETEKKLKDLSMQSGRGTDDLVEDAMAGYFDEHSKRGRRLTDAIDCHLARSIPPWFHSLVVRSL